MTTRGDPGATSVLIDAVQRLSMARTAEEAQAVVKDAARRLVGSDGVTFVLRDGDKCHYVDEDAIEPLWKGQRFPLEACISGWAMLNKDATVIPDIYVDDRIPHEAYRPTFVKSLVMVPIRTLDPIGAIGSYWADHHAATPEEVAALRALADSTAVALENVRVYEELEQRVADRTAALQAANEEIRQLALTDDLTGLNNRRGFLLLAGTELKVLQRSGRPAQVLFADIDGLKLVNDTLGHDAGSALIVDTADVFRAACRDADVLGRIGGDELALFVPDGDDTADLLVERLQRGIDACNERGDRPYRLAVSMGTATIDPVDPRTLEEHLAAADQAMYAAKRARRVETP